MGKALLIRILLLSLGFNFKKYAFLKMKDFFFKIIFWDAILILVSSSDLLLVLNKNFTFPKVGTTNAVVCNIKSSFILKQTSINLSVTMALLVFWILNCGDLSIGIIDKYSLFLTTSSYIKFTVLPVSKMLNILSPFKKFSWHIQLSFVFIVIVSSHSLSELLDMRSTENKSCDISVIKELCIAFQLLLMSAGTVITSLLFIKVLALATRPWWVVWLELHSEWITCKFSLL